MNVKSKSKFKLHKEYRLKKRQIRKVEVMIPYITDLIVDTAILIEK